MVHLHNKIQSIKERRSQRAPLGAPLTKWRARARPPLLKKFDERERERRSQNRRALAMSAARRFEFLKTYIVRDCTHN